MQAKNLKIVEEIEACKDILWFLEGYTKSNKNSDATNVVTKRKTQ